MRTFTCLLWGAIFALAAPVPKVCAQTVRFDVERGVVGEVHAHSGFDGAVLPLGLGGAVALDVAGRPLVLGMALTTPLLSPGIDDLQFESSAEYDLGEGHGWMLRPGVRLAVLTTSNEVFDATGLSAELGLFGGWSDPIWAAGIEVAGRLNIVSHLRSSEWGREISNLSSDAVLFGNGYAIEVGGRVGVLLGPVEIFLRGGWRRRGELSQAPPFYVTLGVGGRFL